ncbi:MAG: hypothetical protein Q8906_05140, partial [Bacillota bacterium]|nr:hypothetical protein [Bacillota bacterium]
LGLLMAFISPDLYHDTVYAAKWNDQTWIPFAFTVGVLLPLILMIVNICKMKLKDKQSKS